MRPRTCSSMCLVRIGDWPIKDPGDEGAQHGVDADRVGRQRHQSSDHEDGRDDEQLADETIVGPAVQPKDDLSPDGKADPEEQGCASQAWPSDHRSMVAM